MTLILERSSIIKRFCDDAYDEKIEATIGQEILKKEFRVGSEDVQVRISFNHFMIFAPVH